MKSEKKPSRRRAAATLIAAALAGIVISHLFGYFRDMHRRSKNLGTVLPVPRADSGSGFRFSITPDTQKLLCIEDRFKRQKVYLSDFPPEGSGSYREVLTLPNYEHWASRPAFCGGDASKFALVGCYWRGTDVPEFPEFKNKKEYESWIGAHPRYTLKTVNGETDIDYSLAGFYLVIADLNEGKSDFLLRIPDEISGEPANITTSLCWPLRDLIFLGIRDSVYKVSLQETPPKLEKILTLPKEIENAWFGSIKGMYYNTEENTLTAAASYINAIELGTEKQRTTIRLAGCKFDLQEESLVSVDMTPEAVQAPRPVMSSDNSSIAAVALEETLLRAFIKRKGKISVMSFNGNMSETSLKIDSVAEESFPFLHYPEMETVSSDGSIIIYREGSKYRYRRIGLKADELYSSHAAVP